MDSLAAGILDRKFQVSTVHFVLFCSFLLVSTPMSTGLDCIRKGFMYAETREAFPYDVRKKQVSAALSCSRKGDGVVSDKFFREGELIGILSWPMIETLRMRSHK
jgi:hypothetical protein